MSISLCMVVYNERHRLPDTLSYALPLVDEVCIVDQHSDDGTWEWLEEVARLSHAIANSKLAVDNPVSWKIIRDQHWGFCEPSRKLAHQISMGDWILVLDADERISDEAAVLLRDTMERSDECMWYGARLERSLYIGGEHRFTGDYQYRFFRRDAVRYLDEIHTEPQPTIHKDQIRSIPAPALIHEKSWTEQIRDDLAYEKILQRESGIAAQRKRELNVHLALLREKGITPEEADAMTIEERRAAGIGAA